MAEELDGVVEEIADVIGLDAWHIFPDSKRLVPDTVIWGFASACLLELVKNTIDFKALGNQLRTKIEECVKKWREKRDFEAFSSSPEMRDIVVQGLEAADLNPSEEIKAESILNLEKSLAQIGMTQDQAKLKAAEIARIVYLN